METNAEHTLVDKDATGFVSTGRGPVVEIRLDDLAFLIEAGLKEAWATKWPGPGAEVSLDAMTRRAEGLLLDIAIAKRRIKGARRILSSLFPGNEKWRDEFWREIPDTGEVGMARCCCRETAPRVPQKLPPFNPPEIKFSDVSERHFLFELRDRARIIIDSGETDVTEKQMLQWDTQELTTWLDAWAEE